MFFVDFSCFSEHIEGYCGMRKLMTSGSTVTLKGPCGAFMSRPSMQMLALCAFSTTTSRVR